MIRLRYTWDLPTCLAGYRVHYRLRMKERGHVLLGSLLVALTLAGAGMAVLGKGDGLLAAGSVASLYWFVLRWPLYRWQLTGRFRQQAGRNEEIGWEGDAQGFRGASPGLSGEVGGEQVAQVVETTDGFLVSLAPGFYWFPRTAFGGSGAEQSFRQLAREQAAVYEVLG